MAVDSRVEAEIATALKQDDGERATSALLRGYGDEILSYLAGLTTDLQVAEDVFSDFCERAWRSIDRFAGRSSARTWAYVIARNAFHDYLRAKASEERRRVRVSSDVIANVAADVATRTLTFLKTATKDRFTGLRARLPLEDQEIIVLRIDRDLPWTEIVEILGDTDDDDVSVKRRSAALRKRYERIKEEIRALARSEGLLPDDS